MSASPIEFDPRRVAKPVLQRGPESPRPPAGGVPRRTLLAAAVGLALSLIGALGATAIGREGRAGLAALLAAVSLLLAGLSGCLVIPGLVRRSLLGVNDGYAWTRGGWLYVAIVSVIGAAAFNTGNNLLYLILALLLAGLVVSALFAKWALDHLELNFVFPEHIFAQEETRAFLTVRNRKGFCPTFSMTLTSAGQRDESARTEPPNPGETVATFLKHQVHIPYIPALSGITETVELKFPVRGCCVQEGFVVESKFPFGILSRSRRFPGHYEIVVLPRFNRNPSTHPSPGAAEGVLESTLKASGGQPCSLRAYAPGDPARLVDWKASAKVQRLMVRELTREQENRMTLIFDTAVKDLSPGEGARFERSVEACAGLAWRLSEAGAWMEFLSPTVRIPMSPAASVIFEVLEALALIQPVLRTEGAALRIPWAARAAGHYILFSAATPWESEYPQV
jgi:uncharacterized protein (DUF58 family)